MYDCNNNSSSNRAAEYISNNSIIQHLVACSGCIKKKGMFYVELVPLLSPLENL